jgi:hypothetical protein
MYNDDDNNNNNNNNMTEMQELLCPKMHFCLLSATGGMVVFPGRVKALFLLHAIHTGFLFILTSYPMTNGDNYPGGQRGRNAELALNSYQTPHLRLCRDVGSQSILHRGSIFNLVKPTGNFTHHQV